MRKARRTVKQENPANTPATSKPLLKIEFAPACREQIRALSKENRQVIGKAIDDASKAWGRPHLHGGTGLRKLKGTFYECRSGLQTRLVFEALKDGSLYLHLMGSHDEVRRYIRMIR